MVKRGYFKGATFPVNDTLNTIIIACAYLTDAAWVGHISLHTDGVEVKQKDIGEFADLAEALHAANECAWQYANDGNTDWDGL